MHRNTARHVLVAAAAAAALCAAGCSGSGTAATVPSLGASGHGGQGAASGSSSSARATALHAAAQCIRQHGIPGYSDPVLTASGQVYSDSRSFQDASQAVVNTVARACGALMTQAQLNPGSEPPAPPQLVQAGVVADQCMRAHGLTNLRDPTAQTPYTPGHGFEMDASEVPAGGKASPIWQHARQACATLVDAEIRASTLGSLSNDS